MKLYIQNMVCLRCKIMVKAKLQELGIGYKRVDLGEIEIYEKLPEDKLYQLKECLLTMGLKLIEDQKAVLVEKIKSLIIEMVHYEDEFPNVKHSCYISEKLHHNYTYLANLFSEIKGCTLESFIIMHKIERAKEMILFDDISLTEIAYKLNYSSVGHLSNQFKKVTGLTPSFFKKIKQKRLNPLADE